MAWTIRFSLCIIAVFVLNSVRAVVNFRISPTRYDLDGNNQVTSLSFDCSPGSDFTARFQTVIGRRIGQSEETIISMQIVGPEFEWGTTNLQQRISTPQVDKTAMSIRFNLQNPTCQDATYTYYCTVTGNSPTTPAGGSQMQDVNITAQTRPRNITMLPYPRKDLGYQVGQSVIFTCSGRIGNNFENSNQYDQIFQWETRNLGSSFSWQDFRPTENITVSGAPTQEANCQYRFTSELHYTVTAADTNRQFRCKVSSDEYSANYTVTLLGTTTGTPGGVGGPADAGVNVGMVIGIVVGVLALIVIIIVVVYFVVFRKRRDGDDYDTGEGKSERPEMTDNVVYTTPASKQPNRGGKGRENEGLDEPQEKNPRGYYANDFGRANPAMDDEDYKHNRSYDDDNTDTRGGRPPYGSAV